MEVLLLYSKSAPRGRLDSVVVRFHTACTPSQQTGSSCQRAPNLREQHKNRNRHIQKRIRLLECASLFRQTANARVLVCGLMFADVAAFIPKQKQAADPPA